MLLDLLEQLVAACLQFGRQRQAKQRVAFGDLVEPVYQLYQQVHEQYLANLQAYRTQCNEPGSFAANVEAVCGRLIQDNRFSADQQAKVVPFMELSRQQLTTYARDDKLIGFITEIRSYLSRAFTEVCGTQYTGGTLRVMSPVFRNSLAGQLRKIVEEGTLSEDQKRAAAAKVLDGIVAEFQRGFAAVTESYLGLRREMAG